MQSRQPAFNFPAQSLPLRSGLPNQPCEPAPSGFGDRPSERPSVRRFLNCAPLRAPHCRSVNSRSAGPWRLEARSHQPERSCFTLDIVSPRHSARGRIAGSALVLSEALSTCCPPVGRANVFNRISSRSTWLHNQSERGVRPWAAVKLNWRRAGNVALDQTVILATSARQTSV